MRTILKYGLLNAFGTAAYIIVIASFMYYLQMEKEGSSPNVFIPIAMLLLFVFSAAFTGFLVFGKPAMWYIDGKKKEALSLLAYTLIFLFLIILVVFFLILTFL